MILEAPSRGAVASAALVPVGQSAGISSASIGPGDQSGGSAAVATTADSASVLTPSLTVDAAIAAHVMVVISGLASDMTGTVTFTDQNGKQDVLTIGGNGTYTTDLSNLATGGLTYLLTATNPEGDVVNVDPVAMLGDGSANAPAGAAQLPNLLNGYAVRPSWYVAGVDYHVGVPTGLALKNPSTISMAGVSVNTSSHMISITGSNVTLNGYDFSLNGGWGIRITGGASNVTIENSNFMVGANNNLPIQTDSTVSNLTVLNNTFDGSGTTNPSNICAFIYYLGKGAFTAKYNSFQNAPADAIDFGGSGTTTPTVEYNVFNNLGTAAGSHPDTVQFYGSGTYNNSLISFNTIYQPRPSGEEGIQIAAQGGETITNTTVANNTIIAPSNASGVTMSYLIAVQTAGAGNINNGGVIQNNYFGIAGAYGAIYPIASGNTNWTVSNNVDLANGNIVQANNSETAAVTQVTQVTASPGSGVEFPGDKIVFTVQLSKAATVTGVPTLSLNNGGVAAYTGGSGTDFVDL